MTIVFEPKIDLPVGAIAPDSFDDSYGFVPPDNFIVSRHRDGTVASTYGKLSWNMSAYHPEVRSVLLNFSYWKTGELTVARDQISREARWLIFALIWKRKGRALSIKSLRNYLSVVTTLAQFAEDVSLRIQDVINDKNNLSAFVRTRCSGWMTQNVGSLLQLFVRIGVEQLGFDVVDEALLKELRTSGREYRETLNQHPPLPTRIYSFIISSLSRELYDWESIADPFLTLLDKCARDPLMGRHELTQYRAANKLGLDEWEFRPDFSQLLTDSNVEEYLKAKDLHIDVRGLSGGIMAVQMTSKLTIQVFSGMRDDEAVSLPYHCIKTSITNGKTHYIILGRTTKLNNGRIKRTRWVTNQEGYKAILTAQKIADSIYAVCGVEPKKARSRTNDYPLFVSPAYLGLTGSQLSPLNGRFLSGVTGLRFLDGLRSRLQPIIEDLDLRELEHIDPHRAWRSEPAFQIGKPWVFTSHQLRRSLALYAQRSGLVSLPSLRRQLQHITEEMSRYYARGSAFARNFIGDDKEHFGLDWQESQPLSSALSYILNVLLTKDVLFGGHANWVDYRLRGTDGIVAVDRDATIRRFKKGELAYRETSLGGCANVCECDQVALKWLDIDCISRGCSNMVGNLSKLERVIAVQSKFVGSLPTDSLEHRTEKSDLDVLVAARDRVLQQQQQRGESR